MAVISACMANAFDIVRFQITETQRYNIAQCTCLGKRTNQRKCMACRWRRMRNLERVYHVFNFLNCITVTSAGAWKRIGAMVRPRPLFTDISILFVVYKMASYGVSAMIGLRTAHGDILLHQILIRQLIRLKITDMDYFEPVEVTRKIFYDQISCGYRHHLRIVIYAAAYIPAMDATGATADRTGQGQPRGSGLPPRRARIP